MWVANDDTELVKGQGPEVRFEDLAVSLNPKSGSVFLAGEKE